MVVSQKRTCYDAEMKLFQFTCILYICGMECLGYRYIGLLSNPCVQVLEASFNLSQSDIDFLMYDEERIIAFDGDSYEVLLPVSLPFNGKEINEVKLTLRKLAA